MEIVPHLGVVRAALITRAFRRNLPFLFLFEFIWGLGGPFGMYATMVPAYLTVLGAAKSLIGLTTALWTIVAPVQLIGSHFFTGRRRVRIALAFFMVAVGLRFAYDLVVVLAPGLWTPGSAAAAFVGCCAWWVACVWLAQSIYVGVLTDNVPQRRRGMLHGLRAFGLGAGGMLTAWLAARLLGGFPSPLNYRLSFLVGDAVFLVACLSLLFLRDVGRRPLPRGPAPPFLGALTGKARTLVAEPNYRAFLFFHVLNCMANALGTFLVPYAKERVGIPDSGIGVLSLVFLGVNAAFAFVLGRLADRFGYRAVGTAQSLLLVACFLVAAAARTFPAVLVAYGLQALVNQSLLFVLVNMSVELFPELGASDLAALGGTLLLPFVAVVPPLAGMLVDLTHSYFTVFLVAAVLAGVAALGYLFLVNEPRTGRRYAVTQAVVR